MSEKIFSANLLTGATKHSAFSTNHLTDTDKTKHIYSQQQYNKQSTMKLLTYAQELKVNLVQEHFMPHKIVKFNDSLK